MKKFDLFLLIIACGLVSFGYYFSKHFKSDAELGFKAKSKPQMNRQLSSRQPNQTSKVEAKEPAQSQESAEKKNEDLSLERRYVEKFKYLHKCISSQDCDFPQDDPRSYELAIYQEINEHLKNVDMVNSNLKERILMAAAKYSDGYVKETVLNTIMKDKIYSEQWMNVVLDEYIGQYNARLIPDAVQYLKDNSTAEQRDLIHQRIFNEIQTGSPKVANALAENLKLLLDENSFAFYKSKISNLEEGPIRKNLNRELRDYELLTSAG